MVDLESLRAKIVATEQGIGTATFGELTVLDIIAELTALRAKVAKLEALQEVVREAIEEMDGGDSYGSNFLDIRRGYEASVKVMTRPDLDELRRLLAEATPGPVTAIVEKYGATVHSPSGCIAEVYAPNLPELKPNAKLFAAMRNALPALLAEAEAGRKLRDGVESIAMYGEESAYSPRELVDEYDAATKGTT